MKIFIFILPFILFAVITLIVVLWIKRGNSNTKKIDNKLIAKTDGYITTSDAESFLKRENLYVKYTYNYIVNGRTYNGSQVINRLKLYTVYHIGGDFGAVYNKPLRVVYNKENPQESYIDLSKQPKNHEYTGW